MKALFPVAVVAGLLVQGLVRAEQTPPPAPPAAVQAPVATAAPVACCDCCTVRPCGFLRERLWAWLCYQPIQRAGCCCDSAPCCHPPLYLYFADHCKCGHGAPDRLPTKECGCCHGAFLARLRGLFHGTGCATCR